MREETWGEVSPHHPTRGSGERHKLPPAGSGAEPRPKGLGRSPGRKWIYAYFRPQRSHLERHFQYFWAMAGPPKCRGAWENFPPFPLPPSRWAWLYPLCINDVYKYTYIHQWWNVAEVWRECRFNRTENSLIDTIVIAIVNRKPGEPHCVICKRASAT